MSEAKTILVVEDDPNLGSGLQWNLEKAGYRVVRRLDGASGLDAALAENPSLVILDLMLPGMDGMTVLEHLRKRGVAMPVVVLSAIDDEVQKVRSFDLGAVDYVTKPFGLSELLARVRVRLAQGQPSAGARAKTFPLAGGTVHGARLTFVRGKQEAALTPTELEILKALVARGDAVVDRNDLVRAIWGLAPGMTRTLDTHIARLRKKIEPDPAEPRHLLTVHGVGYRLVP